MNLKYPRNLKYPSILCTALAAIALGRLCCLPAADVPDARPNVVLFMSDDHGWADSGAYGDRYVRTPNIDRLARQGMRFTRAFAASPLCSPSRCVVATGLMPWRNGGHKFGTPIEPRLRTMPVYFKELGYHTAPRKSFTT